MKVLQDVRPAAKVWLQRWKEVNGQGEALQLYVLLDLAQDASLAALVPSAGAEGLFGFALDSKEGKAGPWLVHLGGSDQVLDRPSQRLLDHVLGAVQQRACATVIASTCGMAALLAHLRAAMDVKLQGQDAMYLALWDPAILAALMGQMDPLTQDRTAAVLEGGQHRALLGPIARWWCWSRAGRMHEYAPAVGASVQASPLPLRLRKAQVDALVESSVPDLLMYYLRLNQPELSDLLAPLSLHWFVRQQVVFARRYGLKGTRDLLNYVSLALMLGARFDRHAGAAAVLKHVRAGSLGFDQAMEPIGQAMREPDLEKPRVLLDEAGHPLPESRLPG